MSNPLLTSSGLPLFDQVKAEHVAEAVEQILSQSAELLAEAEQAPLGDWDALMEPMRKIDHLFLVVLGWFYEKNAVVYQEDAHNSWPKNTQFLN